MECLKTNRLEKNNKNKNPTQDRDDGAALRYGITASDRPSDSWSICKKNVSVRERRRGKECRRWRDGGLGFPVTFTCLLIVRFNNETTK